MKILFIPHNCIPFNAETLSHRPLGGIETGVINLAKSLSDQGHDVIVSTSEENPPLSVPLYIPQSAIPDVGEIDVLISVRGWEPLFLQINAKIKILWTGDSYDQPQNIGIADLRIQNNIDILCCVSNWHKDTLCKTSGFPLSKCFVLRNGVDAALYSSQIERVSKRLIYSSTPYRGLKYLPAIYSKLLEIHPDSSLHICSGYGVYAGAGEYPKEMLEEYENVIKILERLPGVEIIGNIPQAQLAQEFQKASILSYPNIFEETSCITVLEAQKAQCIPVTSYLGALPETVENTGICIKGQPGTLTYDTEFIKVIDEIFRLHNVEKKFRDACDLKSQRDSWEYIAKDFSEFLGTLNIN